MQGQIAKTDMSPIQAYLAELHRRLLPVTDGTLPTYIPELASVNPDRFGIALVTTDGHCYEVGDTAVPFTIQSISKAIVYGLALQDHGRDAVLARIGVEPSGDPFNSIVFDERSNRPFNPMVNAGAIAATALIRGQDAAQRLQRILDAFGLFVGRPVSVDEAVYRSETSTGHRNRAIAYLELNASMIEGDVEAHLDLYFRQCSILVTARDLAAIAATLANGGTNPLTGQRALATEHVRDVLSVMTSCGMYDYAGEWEFRVGLPAKSGVSGGIMATLPGHLGIGVFSPRLDERGNSLRGVKLCDELAGELKLHMLDYRGSSRTALRRIYRGSQVHSKRMRRAAVMRMLDRLGAAICVYELHGDLSFANSERIIRRALDDIGSVSHFILDAERVTSIDDVAAQLLARLQQALAREGKTVLMVLRRDMRDRIPLSAGCVCADTDTALETCENALLAQVAEPTNAFCEAIDLSEVDFLDELGGEELEAMRRRLTVRDFPAGSIIIHEGAPADGAYFLLRGSVDVGITMNDRGDHIRLGTVDAGNLFGEVALFGSTKRTADIVARTDVTVALLDVEQFAALGADHPDLQRKLLVAVGRSLSERLRKANAEIRALAL